MHFLLAEAAVDHVKAVAWISLLIGLAWIVLALFWFAATRECAATLHDVLKELRAVRRQLDSEREREHEREAPPPQTDFQDEDAALRFLGSERPPQGRKPDQ